MAEAAENVKEEVESKVSENGSAKSLLSTARSKEVLIPALLSAGAAIAAAKGSDLLRKGEEKAGEEAEQIGEKTAKGAKKGIMGGGKGSGLAKVAGAAVGKGGSSSGPQGKTRRLPIQRWTDIAVPVEVAYREWTNFEEFPKFMHRVLTVEKEENNKLRWDEKIWFSRRQWEGEITERRKNDRIAWKTTSGMQHAGVVSFHQIGPRLTRVMVTMDFVPQGMIEKMASGMRFVKRAVEADLARFKAQVEMKDAKGLEYRSGSEEQRDDDDDADAPSSRERRASARSNRQNGDNDEDRNDDRERESAASE